MREDVKIVLRDIGSLLLICGVATLLLLPVAGYYREWDAIPAILLMAAAFAAVGWPLSELKSWVEPRFRHAMMVAAGGWLVVPLVSTIPFIQVEGMGFIDAFFEAMSGWTGSGFTMIANLEPTADGLHTGTTHTLLFWRSLMQWIGGVGVIVLTLSIVARSGAGAQSLYKAEGRDEKIRPTVIGTVREIWWIYVLLTALGLVLVFAAGMPLWDALNHAMTAIATGGYSTKDASIGAYDSIYIELALVTVMFAGMVAFLVHFHVIGGNVKHFLKDVQVRYIAAIIAIATALLAYELWVFAPDKGWGWAVRESLFHFVSGMSTGGFQTFSATDLGSLPDNAKLLIALGMILGGAAGSTAGGIKIFRGILLARGIAWKAKRVNLPANAVTSFKLYGKTMSDNEVNRDITEASFILFLWAIVLVAGSFIMMHLIPGHSLVTVFFEVSSTLSNVGISAGVYSPAMSDAAKLFATFMMWVGRLEIFPVIIFVREILRPGRVF
ncbi:MAG TPA: TrkH family potassium uptake protein [Candidatus Thermoplasmatota archaeon]|nr:TrkH family potassium uptake protein [Candidatus Thermoplasmatota archaeon]